MRLENSPKDTGPVDARPELKTSTTTAWQQAYSLRERYISRIEDNLARQNVRALVTRSVNGTYPPWLRVEAWMPAPDEEADQTDPRVRCELQIVIDIRPFHEHEIVTTASANNGKKRIRISDRPGFTADDAAEWAAYTIRKGSTPKNYTPWADFFANLFLAFIPFARMRHSNRIQYNYRNILGLSIPFALLVIGGLIALTSEGSSGGITVGLLFLAASLVIYARRQKIVSVINRPDISPRALLLVDSWQSVVPDLGERHANLRERIIASLNSRSADGINVEEETYGYRTPNGYEERERVVVTKGQGVAQVHIYHFGSDVYVGWDSYVNWAKWGETSAVSARSNISTVVEYRSLREEVYIPNQFDLIDLNSLSEVVHRDVTDVVKAMMAEQKIDQEIDFQIIRGDRESALDKSRFDKTIKGDNRPGQRSNSRRWSIKTIK